MSGFVERLIEEIKALRQRVAALERVERPVTIDGGTF